MLCPQWKDDWPDNKNQPFYQLVCCPLVTNFMRSSEFIHTVPCSRTSRTRTGGRQGRKSDGVFAFPDSGADAQRRSDGRSLRCQRRRTFVSPSASQHLWASDIYLERATDWKPKKKSDCRVWVFGTDNLRTPETRRPRTRWERILKIKSLWYFCTTVGVECSKTSDNYYRNTVAHECLRIQAPETTYLLVAGQKYCKVTLYSD